MSSCTYHTKQLSGGDDHRRALEHFKPGLDLAAARRERVSSGHADLFDQRDLYPDAQPCILKLRSAGYRVGIARKPTTAGRRGTGSDRPPSRLGGDIGALGRGQARSPVLRENHRMGRGARDGDRLRRRSSPQRYHSRARRRVGSNFHRARTWGRAHVRRPEIALAARTISGTLGLLLVWPEPDKERCCALRPDAGGADRQTSGR